MPPVRIAVVSPFIDKRHGTERRIAEWISRLPLEYEIHIYSQRVEDVDLTRMKWHRIPANSRTSPCEFYLVAGGQSLTALVGRPFRAAFGRILSTRRGRIAGTRT